MTSRPASSLRTALTHTALGRATPRRTVLSAAAAAFALGAGLHAPTAKAVPEDAVDKDDKGRASKSRAWFTDSVLVDQHGRRHRFYSDLLAPAGRERVVLVHPLFTSCSSACPLIVQRLVHMRQAMQPARRDELSILSLSVDPLGDTPPVLAAFADKQGANLPGWYFLGGAIDDVERVARRLGLWTDTPEDHQTLLIAGRPSRAHWIKLRPDLEPRALVQQLDRFW